MYTSNESDFKVQPFLTWAGGKRWFTYNHCEVLPNSFNNYIEPFLGSGAIFFALKPSSAILSDSNAELIHTYMAIKENWKKIVIILYTHQHNHSRSYYYKIRNSKPTCMYSRAARFIYLNRTCWNGLYRVNKNGVFNVPIGTKTNVLYKTESFENISKLLSNVNLLVSDFECVIDLAQEDDFIFADPPYTVKHDNNNFIKYNDIIFKWQDQIRLRDSLLRAKNRGAKILLTNANHNLVRRLYAKYFRIDVTSRSSVLSGDPSGRGIFQELIIRGNV